MASCKARWPCRCPRARQGLGCRCSVTSRCVHVAMFDAVNSIEERYEPYRVRRAGVTSVRRPRPRRRRPGMTCCLSSCPGPWRCYDAALANQLVRYFARADGGRASSVGKKVAEEIIALRSRTMAGRCHLRRPYVLPTFRGALATRRRSGVYLRLRRTQLPGTIAVRPPDEHAISGCTPTRSADDVPRQPSPRTSSIVKVVRESRISMAPHAPTRQSRRELLGQGVIRPGQRWLAMLIWNTTVFTRFLPPSWRQRAVPDLALHAAAGVQPLLDVAHE